MLPRLVLGTVLSFAASAFAASDNDTISHDLFIASDNSLALTLNIANDSDDVYFSFIGPDASSWIAFGLGSDKMESALIFLVYTSSSGKNITLSPRLPSNHVEPEYSSDIHVELLPGTGYSNGTLTANFKCSNCRGANAANLKNYNLDVTSTSQKMCFASGPSGEIKSDNPNAPIKRHSSYGSFTMDMQKATGAGGVAVAPISATPDLGATETSNKSDRDFSAPLHAAIMIFAFVILLPFGMVIVRALGWVKWHGINQGFATLLVVIGAGLGVYIGRMYNRSKKFDTGHQIFGIIIIVAMVAQFVLGYMHHRIYKKTQSTTKMAPIHVWLGRILIPAGIINAFLGFPLALSHTYDYWLAGLIVAVSLPITLILIWSQRRKARKAREAAQPQYPEAGGMAAEQSGAYPAINLQRMERAPPAYTYGDQSRPTDFQGPPVEPWQRV